MVERRTHFKQVAGSRPSRSSRKMVECRTHFSPGSSTDAHFCLWSSTDVSFVQ